MKTNVGSRFDAFLKKEKLFDITEAVAIKRLLASQVQNEIKKKGMSKLALAKRMRTSRSSIDRLLDPQDLSITLKTLVKVAHIFGKKIDFAILP